VNYDNSLVVTITVTCYSWASSSGDHLFTCGAIYRPPQAQWPRFDSHQNGGQHVRCYECQRTGHVARFCPGRSTQSNSQGNQWHTPQWKQCYEDQQRHLQQLQAQVAHQFEGPQFQIPPRHPFLQRCPRIHRAKNLVI